MTDRIRTTAQYLEFLARAAANERRQRAILKENPHRQGCYYRPHAYMVNSGTFWRCKHGRADGCARCALAHPLLYLRWHAMPYLRRVKVAVDEGVMLPDTIAGVARIVYAGDAPDDVVLWLRLPSFDYVHDFARDRWGMQQRVLRWHSAYGWSIGWR